ICLLGCVIKLRLCRSILGVLIIALMIRDMPPIDIPILSHIPVLGPILFQYDPLVYLAFLLVPLSQIFIFKTNLGLKIRTVGENPKQADSLGVDVHRIRYLAVIIGGALAGIGGSYVA